MEQRAEQYLDDGVGEINIAAIGLELEGAERSRYASILPRSPSPPPNLSPAHAPTAPIFAPAHPVPAEPANPPETKESADPAVHTAAEPNGLDLATTASEARYPPAITPPLTAPSPPRAPLRRNLPRAGRPRSSTAAVPLRTARGQKLTTVEEDGDNVLSTHDDEDSDSAVIVEESGSFKKTRKMCSTTPARK